TKDGRRPTRVRKMIREPIWLALEPALREARHSQAGAPGALSDREFLEGVLCLNRVGCPWRDLPAALGCWHAVYMRFRRWEKRGVWQRLWKNLQTERFAQARALFMDPTTIRTHPHAAGAPKKNGPGQALGRSRGGWGTKIHAATTDENCSAALHPTPGEAHDGRQFESLCESLDPDHVLESAALGKGCDADRIRERLAADGIQPVIPPIRTRTKKLHDDKAPYRESNRIERLFNRLKQSRRIAIRYDTLRDTFFSALCLIAAFLIAKNS
ncbi:MAG: IS5 family transposase, partial [Chthoniobacteraceae bacterium]